MNNELDVLQWARDSWIITVDHSESGYPYAYYDDEEGITSANNPVFWYAIGLLKSNYPMPALRMRTFNSLVRLGFTSAENNFDVDTVFEYYIKD